MPDIHDIHWWIQSTAQLSNIEKMMYHDDLKDNLGEPW